MAARGIPSAVGAGEVRQVRPGRAVPYRQAAGATWTRHGDAGAALHHRQVPPAVHDERSLPGRLRRSARALISRRENGPDRADLDRLVGIRQPIAALLAVAGAQARQRRRNREPASP
jgi:hypothetical protein